MDSQILHAIFSCFCYAICSMAFSFSAKFLFKIFAFNHTIMFLLYEATFNIIICTILTLYKMRNVGFELLRHRLDKKELNFSLMDNIKQILLERVHKTLKTLPYSLTYGFGVLCGMKALSIINIPMFLALKRTLIFFVFITGFFFGNRQQEGSQIFVMSVFMITMGTLIAGFKQLNTDLTGYALVLLNNCCSAFSLHLAKYLNKKDNLSPLELVYNNSLNLWPIFLIMSLISGEFHAITEFHALYNTEFIISITIVAFFGFCLHFCTNYCTMQTSPFAIALTHNIKDILSTSLSLIVFSDLQIDRFLIGGIALSFSGSFLYSYTKIKQYHDQKQSQLPSQQPEQLSTKNSLLFDELKSFIQRQDLSSITDLETPSDSEIKL